MEQSHLEQIPSNQVQTTDETYEEQHSGADLSGGERPAWAPSRQAWAPDKAGAGKIPVSMATI